MYQDDRLNALSGLSGEIDELAVMDAISRVKTLLRETRVALPFPKEVFPERLQAHMDGCHRIYGSAVDHYGLAMLTVAGIAMGNAVRLYDRGGSHPPCFYSALVAPPGSGKTPIISSMIAPIRKRAKAALDKYKLMVAELKEEAKRQGDDAVLPPAEKPLVSSFTMEALYSCLLATPRGIMVYRDELAAWMHSMNQYKAKGDDKEFFLTAHNAESYTVDRKNLEIPIFIERVMLCVLGGVQPGVLEAFTDQNSQQSGFLSRILFSWPTKEAYRPYHDDVPDEDYARRWEKIIGTLYDLTYDTIVIPARNENEEKQTIDVPQKVFLSGGAKKLYAEYYDSLQERVERSQNEVEQATLVKFRTHCLRLALALHGLEYAALLSDASEEDYYAMVASLPKKISPRTMEGAISLSMYFEQTGLRVVGGIDDPSDTLPDNQRAWYKGLPEEGSRAVAIQAARAADVSQRTVDRLIRRKDLFRYTKGTFEKLF